MKSCIQWRKGFKYLSQIDEFNIDYKNKEIKLVNFLEHYAKTQRVNIRLPKDYTKDDIDLLEAIFERDKPNIALILPDKYYIDELKEKEIPYYFPTLITSWDELISTLELYPSDVFISGELGFDLEKVFNITQKNNVRIRCYANVVQSSSKRYKQGFKNFFIRPEDIDWYSNFVDVIEFYDSIEQQNVLYTVYFKDKEWNGDLREIIKGLSLKINNYYILGSEFGRRRTHCQKRCFKGERCVLCDRLVELADTLNDNKQYQVYKRRD